MNKLKQALETIAAWDSHTQAFAIDYGSHGVRDFYRQIARQALAEEPAQQEPVAWKHDCAALLTNDVELWIDRCPHCGKPRTSPPAQRNPLTDEEIGGDPIFRAGVRFAEARHGIKD